MANYTGFQSILDAALGEYRFKGFRLTEDEHFLYLYHDGERVAVFSAVATTPETVLLSCQQHLVMEVT